MPPEKIILIRGDCIKHNLATGDLWPVITIAEGDEGGWLDGHLLQIQSHQTFADPLATIVYDEATPTPDGAVVTVLTSEPFWYKVGKTMYFVAASLRPTQIWLDRDYAKMGAPPYLLVYWANGQREVRQADMIGIYDVLRFHYTPDAPVCSHATYITTSLALTLHQWEKRPDHWPARFFGPRRIGGQ